MRFIFIVQFLVSMGSVSFGGVGDVYFCSEVQHTDIYRGSCAIWISIVLESDKTSAMVGSY